MIPFYAVLLAGGVGSRMGTALPKQFMPLMGKPVIEYSLEALRAIDSMKGITIVSDPNHRPLCSTCPHTRYAPPGSRRQDSLHNALRDLPGEETLILVHDAARPFLTPSIIQRVLQSAADVGAAAAAVPLVATVKQANNKGRVTKTLDRKTLWEVQTPQVVPLNVLREGLNKCRAENIVVTDDVSVAELMGLPVQMVKGCPQNLKLTTPHDFAFAEFLLSCPITV